MVRIFLAKRNLRTEIIKLKALRIKQERIIYEAKIKKADIRAQIAFNEQCIRENILTKDEVEEYEEQNKEAKSLFKAIEQAEKEVTESEESLGRTIEGEKLYGEGELG